MCCKLSVHRAEMLFIKVIFFNIILIRCEQRARRPTVNLQQGTLVGTKVYGDFGKVADAYFGIPYAAAPIGLLRFAPPQKHSGWNGTYQASEYKPRCPQLPFFEKDSEDCLYLNIWTPENALARFGQIPVVIFFEGFEFARSNRIPISGQDLAMEGLVIVTTNYRLNAFGFLCLGIPEARGNLGLLDQYLSIIWVRENIKLFGGDPDKITLFGHSAGAASVVLHMISTRTAGYFQRVILSSGSAVSPWHIAKEPFVPSQKISRILGCFHTEPKVVLVCLQNKSTIEIMNAYKEYSEMENVGLFLPVVDNFLVDNEKYLSVDPEKALKDGTYLQVPILTGISKLVTDAQYNKWVDLANQGLWHLQQYMELTKFSEIIKRYNFDGQNKEQVVELLKWRYIGSSRNDVHLQLDELKSLDFEAKTEAPHFLQLNYLETSYVQPIYVYNLEDDNFTINTTDTTITSDLLLLFGPLLLNQLGRRRFNSNEQRLSNILKQACTNFINYGNPTPNNNNWRRYMPNDYYIKHLTFNTVNSNEEVIIRNRRITFWTQLLPKISQLKSPYANNNPRELHFSHDPAASFRHAMYTLVGLVIALLILLLICIILLKKRYRERERHLHMGY